LVKLKTNYLKVKTLTFLYFYFTKRSFFILLYYGIDLHSDRLTVYTIAKDQNNIIRRDADSVSNDEVESKLLKKFKGACNYVVVEASSFAFEFVFFPEFVLCVCFFFFFL